MDQPHTPHPNLAPEINDAIARSEAEGGAYLKDLAVGKRLSVVTRNRVYTVEHREDGLYIQGHPKYCPAFTKVKIPGSTFGGSMLKMGFIGIGMYMEFYPEGYESGQRCVTTSEIQDVKEEDAAPTTAADASLGV